jgi:hypothetical protein
MAFVPKNRHDVFVSYAHVDDEPLEGAKIGWVTALVHCIKTRLAQKLGRSDAYSLWMDHELSGHIPITQQILDSVRQAATLVVIMSPGYVASEWCRREKDAFLDVMKQKDSSRVFVIERDFVYDVERPDEFRELKGFRFWVKDREGKAPRILGSPKLDATEQEYYNQVDDLCHELANELRRLKAISSELDVNVPASGAEEVVSATEQPTVFLAEVTDDLEIKRNNFKRYLNQLGVNVVPVTWHSQEPNAFKLAVEQELTTSKLFVQLLSSVAGKKPPDLPQGYSQLQLELARAAGKPILQWRSPTLDVASITDADQRALLEAVTVRAEELEDFKREIRKRLFEKPEPPPEKHLNAFVFVNMETADRPLAERVCALLDRYGADYVLPVQSRDPAENRKDMEQNLLTCDAVVVVYGKSTVTWVRRQLLECRKIFVMRKSPLAALAVFEGPPPQKDCLNMKLRNMQIINCRQGFDENELTDFLEIVQREVA